MIGSKIILVIISLNLCWALASADEDNDNLNNTDDLGEEVTLSYDFEEKLDQLAESVAFLMAAFNKTQEELKQLRQAQDQSSPTLSTAAKESSKAKLNVLEVKCPNGNLPESCSKVDECKSDIYSIMIPSYSNHSLAVSCDLKTENGGWTVIQRRQDGSVDFYRNWTEYVQGFGDISAEFFIGLEKLHILTTQTPQELYIILEDFEGVKRYAKYQTFKINSSDSGYKLTVGNYSGDAGDSLTYHNGQKFSTWDSDNDASQSHCAVKYKGAWWHYSCYESSLNGKYLMGTLSSSTSGHGVSWNAFRGSDYSLKFVKMMIRPRKN